MALGDYEYFDLHRMSVGGGGCPYTDPLPTLAPYFVPFRALTSDEVPNLLLAGKTMAQTFLANAATRFHPVEWATGAAAGAPLSSDFGLLSTRLKLSKLIERRTWSAAG